MSLTPDALQSAIAASVRAAEELDARVNIAVVDDGGNLASFIRMPGAFQASIDIAIDKAWTANSFGMATGKFGEALESELPSVRDGLLRRPRVTAFPGGFPIEKAGTRLGGIGVSGGSAEQDDKIALCGLSALMEN